MKLPDGRPLVVDQGILHEPTPDGRIILWLPTEHTAGYQDWERVVTVTGAEVIRVRGVCSVAATSVPVRQWQGTFLAQLLRSLGKSRNDPVWMLPGGAKASQCGARRTGLILAWAEDEAIALDAAQIKSLWPGQHASRSIGPNLHLVLGVESAPLPASPVSEPAPKPSSPPKESPVALAERALRDARAADDRRRTATALADLGLAQLLKGDARGAMATLEEARAEAERLGDRALEADALSNLALAACHSGQPREAREFIGPALAHARAVGDRYAEKLALDRLALALAGLADLEGALPHLLQAVAIAADLGDNRHEADLLWRTAIVLADLGLRERALASAETAVARLRHMRNPTAEWYSHHLANYRSGAAGELLITPAPGSYPGVSIDAGTPMVPPGPTKASAVGPGPLHMALTAAKAMATFVGTGFKTTSPESYQGRLAVCSACEHHTGIRCRICGCITAVKARMLHERCPAGRWPT